MTTPLKILIAEDDREDVILLKRAFVRAEVKAPVYFVRDGREVVDYLMGNSPFENSVAFPLPDILLLDLEMPRMDGFAVLEWLRSQPRLRFMHVVVFSGSDSAADIKLATSLGAASYLVKPHRPEDLVAVVQSLEESWLRISRPESISEPSQALALAS